MAPKLLPQLMQYDDFSAMSSEIVLAASGRDQAAIDDGFRNVRRFIQQSEQRFTRFSESSELAQLNRSAGSWYQASSEMFQVLQEAYRLANETDGLFNPAILPQLKHAGYDRSMDEIMQEPERTSPLIAIESMDYRSVKFDPAANAILMPLGMQVDLGGIAKGWIAEQAALKLAGVCDACAVSAGGDMFLVNLPQGESVWEVGLEDPRNPESDLAILHVEPGAVATSSISKRKWQHNGKLQHHLIDPRTGEPAVTDWLSVTVWAEQAAEAEVYAKALLIAGPDAAGELFSQPSSKAYLAVDKHGWVQGSQNFHEVFNV